MTDSRLQVRLSVRQWLSDRCAGLGTFFYDLCGRLDTGPVGEVCPDCLTPVVRNADDTCPECNDRSEQQRRDNEIAEGAYIRGYAAGINETGLELDW